jgi:YD repeat-containing protein
LSTGNLLSQTDANGITTSYLYDVHGRKTADILPYDSSSSATKINIYNFNGTVPGYIETRQRKVAGVGYSQYSTFTYYDGFGNVVQTKREEDNSRQVAVNVYYDSNGRISKQSNPHFVSFTSSYSTPDTSVKGINYTYDALGRVIKILNPDNTYKTINFSKWNVTTYDENGNKKQYILDAYDRIVNVYEFNEGDVYRTNYTYDTADELTQIKDNQGNVIQFTYDTLGRKTRLVDPDLGTWDYTYDAVGNLIKQEDGNGKNITLTYDTLNRVTQKDASGVTVSYAYDTNANGTLFKVTNSYGEKNFTYDDRYRVIRQQEKRFGFTFNTNYTYDSMDRLLTKTMPNGVVIAYNYSNNTQLFAMSGVLTNVTYNELGLPLSRKYSSGIDSNFTYNSTNLRLEKIKTSNLQDFSYGYDPVGNVLRISDSVNSRSYNMTYDDLDRLLSAVLTNSTSTLWSFTYTYDPIGNIMSVDSLDGNMEYNYDTNPVHAPSQIITTS